MQLRYREYGSVTVLLVSVCLVVFFRVLFAVFSFPPFVVEVFPSVVFFQEVCQHHVQRPNCVTSELVNAQNLIDS